MSLYLLIWPNVFFFVNIIQVATTGSWADHEKVCHSCADGRDSMTCYCDNMCTLYNDCCFDAPAMNTRRFQKYIRFSCFSLYPRSVYLIDGCMRQWRGSTTVRNKCVSPNDFTDLTVLVPVTDTFRNITYRNVYCAECNNVSPYTLSPFSLSTSCGRLLAEVNTANGNITDDFIMQNLIHVNNSWGVYHWDHYRGDMAFIPCQIDAQVQESLSSAVRSCHIRMVSACADDWNFELIRHRCSFSNMHIVYDTNGTLYRNEHCAICNYIAVNNISCSTRPSYGPSYERSYEPSYFYGPSYEPSYFYGPSYIFGPSYFSEHSYFFGPSYGNIPPNYISVIEFRRTCGLRQIYDSAADKCRNVTCNDSNLKPFYGKCVNKGN